MTDWSDNPLDPPPTVATDMAINLVCAALALAIVVILRALGLV